MADETTTTTETTARAEARMEVEILRDYWPLDDSGRVTAGSVVKLPKSEASAIVRAGIATLAKD